MKSVEIITSFDFGEKKFCQTWSQKTTIKNLSLKKKMSGCVIQNS